MFRSCVDPDSTRSSVVGLFDLLPSARISVKVFLGNTSERYESAQEASCGRVGSTVARYVDVRIRDNVDSIAGKIDALHDWIRRSTVSNVRIDLTDTPFSICRCVWDDGSAPTLMFHGIPVTRRHEAFVLAEPTCELVKSLFRWSYYEPPGRCQSNWALLDDDGADVLDYFETHLLHQTRLSSLPGDIRSKIFRLVAPARSDRLEASNERDDRAAFAPLASFCVDEDPTPRAG